MTPGLASLFLFIYIDEIPNSIPIKLGGNKGTHGVLGIFDDKNIFFARGVFIELINHRNGND